jgi:hypothetical protein
MNFKLWLENNYDLVDLVSKFMMSPENQYRVWSCKNDTKGACDGVSVDLAKFLEEHGVSATLLAGTGRTKPLSKDANPEWLNFVSQEEGAEQYLFHVVVVVGDQVIDLTSAQFGENDWLYPLSQFKQDWKKVQEYKPRH